MLGTIVNTATIIAGTIAGAILHAGIKDKYKRVLYDGLGLASLAIGLNATITNFPKSDYPVLFIISIAVGGVVGIRLDIDGNFRRLVERRRQKKDGCPPDSSSSVPCDNRLADGLSTAMFVLGESAALNYWRKYGDFEMILINNDNEVICTKGLIEKFELTNDSYTLKFVE